MNLRARYVQYEAAEDVMDAGEEAAEEAAEEALDAGEEAAEGLGNPPEDQG